MSKETVEKEFFYKNAKAVYIHDYQQFDCVIDLGFMLTTRERLSIKGISEVKYKDWGRVKRILSDLVHGKIIDVKTYRSSFYGVYEADVFIDGEPITDKLNKMIAELNK